MLDKDRSRDESDIWIYHLEDGARRPEADDELIRAVQEEMAYKIEEKRQEHLVLAVSGETASELVDETSKDGDDFNKAERDREQEQECIGIEICAGKSKDFVSLQRECPELRPLIDYLINGEIGQGGDEGRT